MTRKLALCLFVAVGAAVAAAQQSVTGASLTGQVEDPNGAIISQAAVILTNLQTNQSVSRMSDDAGRYAFLGVAPGQYKLVARAPGFHDTEQRLTLALGQAVEVPLKLVVSGDRSVVNVGAEAPMIELVRTQNAETITPKEVEELPLNGRNYVDLALLTPGVSRTNTGSTQRFAETSAVPGQGISVGSQRNLNNDFVVDGLSANDDAANLAGTFYSQEVVQEFQVITSGGIAEFGRGSGGIVNIVTRSGNNGFHARGYGFLRNQRFDATNALAIEKDPLTQGQYGASVSGPIQKDRTFFFSNFEQTRNHSAGVLTISPANVSLVNARLTSVGYQGQQLFTGNFPTAYDASSFFARVDHRLGENNQLSARYSFYKADSPNSRGAGGLSAVSRGTGLDDLDQVLAVSDVATLGRESVNEARFQYTRSSLEAPVNDAIGPAVSIAGVANFGTSTSSPTARFANSVEAVDNVSILRGNHSFKFGGDFLHNEENIAFPGALQGVYNFSSLGNFLAGKYSNFQQAFGAPNQKQSNPNMGVYAQDEWRIHPKLTINAGVRYDVQWLEGMVNTDTNNVSPRLGIAYAPNNKTVVRANFSVIYDHLPLRALSNALQRDGLKYQVAVVPFGTAGAPVFPNVLPAFPAGLLTSITSIDPNTQNSYTENASLQVERELTSNTSLAVGYEHLRGLHLIMSHNVNVPADQNIAANQKLPNLGRPDPRFANNSQFDSIGDSYYDGLTVSLNKRTGRFGAMRLSYNYSKAIDTSGNFFFSQPQDANDIRDERGLSDNDQRHRLTFSGTLPAPLRPENAFYSKAVGRTELSYIFSYSSPLPFNILTGTDRNGDTNVNDRPMGVGRNTGRGFDFMSLDMRLSRKFKITDRVSLDALAEGFNLLNRANYLVPNNIFGTGSVARAGFGAPTAAFDPRQVQFGLRVGF